MRRPSFLGPRARSPVWGGGDYAFFMRTPKYVARLHEELCDLAYPVLRDFASIERAEVRVLIDEFVALYSRRPVAENTGGSRFHNCFWLYLVARCLAPEVIVESGVWKGQSSWIFRRACPSATIHCFDLSFRHLIGRDPTIRYHEHDWARFEFEPFDPGRALCFFDDHVDQARRVREAHAKGFRLLLLDDNPPAHKLYAFGYPGAPTIAMLLDDRLAADEVIEWTWRGEAKRYRHDEEHARAARSLIHSHGVFPDVSVVTNYHGLHTFLSFVRLR